MGGRCWSRSGGSAPNERADYQDFLDEADPAYLVLTRGGRAVAAFGLVPSLAPGRARLTWIMVDPAEQGSGLGRLMMMEAVRRAVAGGIVVVDIAASHLSAPFFGRFGADIRDRTENGWGPGMHRVDMIWRMGERNNSA